MWGMWVDVGGYVGMWVDVGRYVGYVGGCRWVCGWM